jgi:hypothetical protein
MKATDARKLTNEANAPDNEKVKLVLGCWHRAIDKAAAQGRSFIRNSEVERLRTPIPASAHRAALEQLAEDGFKIRQFDERNVTVTEVSW